MKRVVAVLCLALTGCFNFDGKLAACRNDAGTWICGDGGTGGGGSSLTNSDSGVCSEGWCWEYPLPFGSDIGAIHVDGPNDVWVAGASGMIAHYDGRSWFGSSLGVDVGLVSSFCRHGSELYLGVDQRSSTGTSRLYVSRFPGAPFEPVPGALTAIYQLDCGAGSVWAATQSGLGRLSYSSQWEDLYVSDAGESCQGVAERTPSTAIALCAPESFSGQRFVNLRDERGQLELSMTPDASQAMGYVASTLWKTNDGVPTFAVSGERTGELWTYRSPNVLSSLYPSGVETSRQIFDGTAWGATGSIAVGAYGTLLESNGSQTRQLMLTTAGNSYLFAAGGHPSGEAWAGGERGCLVKRDADGGWKGVNTCDLRVVGVGLGPQGVWLVGPTGLYVRDGGWQLTSSFTTANDLWVNPDGGGVAVLSNDRVTYRGFDFAVSNAERMAVLDESRVVIWSLNGVLIDTTLSGASPDMSQTTDTVNVVMAVDHQARRIWVLTPTRLAWSETPGVWVDEDAGINAPFDGVSVAAGRVWVVAGDTVATRGASGSWSRQRYPNAAYRFPIALDDQTALLYQPYAALTRVRSDFVTQQLSQAPILGVFPDRFVVRNSEMWVVDDSGNVLRYVIPPQ